MMTDDTAAAIRARAHVRLGLCADPDRDVFVENLRVMNALTCGYRQDVPALLDALAALTAKHADHVRVVTENYNTLWVLVYPDDPTGWEYPGQIIVHLRQVLAEHADALAARDRRIALLESALAPFARYSEADNYTSHNASDKAIALRTVGEHDQLVDVTLGDLRRARQLLDGVDVPDDRDADILENQLAGAHARIAELEALERRMRGLLKFASGQMLDFEGRAMEARAQARNAINAIDAHLFAGETDGDDG